MFKDDPGTTAPSPRGDPNPESLPRRHFFKFSPLNNQKCEFGFRAFKLKCVSTDLSGFLWFSVTTAQNSPKNQKCDATHENVIFFIFYEFVT